MIVLDTVHVLQWKREESEVVARNRLAVDLIVGDQALRAKCAGAARIYACSRLVRSSVSA